MKINYNNLSIYLRSSSSMGFCFYFSEPITRSDSAYYSVLITNSFEDSPPTKFILLSEKLFWRKTQNDKEEEESNGSGYIPCKYPVTESLCATKEELFNLFGQRFKELFYVWYKQYWNPNASPNDKD